MIDEGLLSAYKLGRVIRVKVSDLDAFIAVSKIEPGTIANLYTVRDLDEAG